MLLGQMNKLMESDFEKHSKMPQTTTGTSPVSNSLDDYSIQQNVENVAGLSSAGRRQQLETLLEKTDEDECFVPSATVFNSTSHLQLQPAFYTHTTTHDDFIYHVDGSAKRRNSNSNILSISSHENQLIRRETIIIFCTLLAILCTTSIGFVHHVAVPLVAILCSWCCFDLFILRIWRIEKISLNVKEIKNTVSSVSSITALQLCQYGCAGEFVGCLFIKALPECLRSLIVLVTIGIFLRSSASPHNNNLTRIFIFLIFIAICRGAAYSITILPASVAPFVVYVLGVVVEISLEGNLPPCPSSDDGGSSQPNEDDLIPIPNKQLSAEETSHFSHQRRRSIMSSTSEKNLQPNSSVSFSSLRGRRTSLPALNMNQHRVSTMHTSAVSLFFRQ